MRLIKGAIMMLKCSLSLIDINNIVLKWRYWFESSREWQNKDKYSFIVLDVVNSIV